MASVLLLFLGAAFLIGVQSQCPQKCKIHYMNKWPGNGYHASVKVKSPVWVKAFRRVRIMIKFDQSVAKLENIHIAGGSLSIKGSNMKKTVATLLFRPDTTIRRGKDMTISFIVRYSGASAQLQQITFWKRVACSNKECTTNNTTTAKPGTTGTVSPTQFSNCNSIITIRNSGPDFYSAMMKIPAKESMKGWKLTIQFTHPIDAISNYAANLIEERGKIYFVMENFVHNSNVNPGVYDFMFLVHFDRHGPTPKIAMVKFGSFQCQISDGLTTPATRPPTTKLPSTKLVTTAVETKPTKVPAVTTEKTTKRTEKPDGKTTNKPPVTTVQPKKTTKQTEKPEEKTTNKPPVTTVQPKKTTKQTEKPEEKTTNKPPVTTVQPKKTTKQTEKPEEKTTKQPTTKKPIEKTTKPTTDSKKTTKSPSCTASYDYSTVLDLSLKFYEAQRSGKLPPSNRIPYRKDSALSDGKDAGLDLTGGYYDAGDFVKFGFPMAYSISVIAWGVVEYASAYKSAGQYNNALDAIKWGTDYFMKCHTGRNEFYGQVGDGDLDHGYWGRPEDMTMKRPSMKIDSSKPGSDLAGETAAALAAASMVFRDSDSAYADKLIMHAKELYAFAVNHKGAYSNSIPNAAKFYKSWSGFNDELTWSAAWLFRATNKATYLTDARNFYTQFGMSGTPQEFSWDDKKAGVQVLMAQITKESSYKSDTQRFCDAILAKRRTPKGLVFISQWGANRHAANVALICLMAADLGIKTTTYRAFARSQIHYMLGDAGRSFVVGFGINPPKRPHHRSSSCPNTPSSCDWNNYNSPNPNPQILYGALVGGPDAYDNYVDDRKDFQKNEVSCDYNAGFQSAVAALKFLQNKGEC